MRRDPNDPSNVHCRDGGELHRHVRGQEHCGDCNVVIIHRGQFIRAATLERAGQ